MRFMHFLKTRSVTSLLRSLALLALTLLLLPALYAQTTGTLLGTVADQSGAVVAGAKITIVNDNTGVVRETVSNQVGRFTFAGVQPGTYAIKVTSEKFKTWQRTNFVINASDTRDIDDIKLEVGSGTERVTVEAATTQVDLVSNGERAAVLSSVEIEKLALVGRNVTELFRVLPGVSAMPSGSNNNATGGNFGFTTAAPVGSPIGNGLSVNGAPYRGGAMLLLDGANIIDPGCNCFSTAVPNPEFTQEVKVQTSNFGADQPNGPVVFTAISKSGGNKYHGSGYFDARNSIFNSNTWQNNNSHAAKQDSSYYYPGGYFGGPVPGTKGKIMAWGGYEYWWQKLPSNAPLTSWVPTSAMRAGNFNPADPENAKYCANMTTSDSSWPANAPTQKNSCNTDLGGTVLPNGTVLPAGAYDLRPYIGNGIDQGTWNNMQALMNLYFPSSNVDPTTNGNKYNWYMPISSQANGWVYRARVDYDISDATKLFLSFQEASNNSFQPAHIWWNPANAVPFPGGGINNPTKAKTASANFLHVFSPTLTNEMILTWNRSNSPYTPADPQANYRTAINWPYKTVFGGGTNDPMLPGINAAYNNQWYPDMSQSNIFGSKNEFPLLKATPSFQDNVSKVYKNHTFKMGFYYTMVGNDQAGFNDPNGTLTFGSMDTSAKDVLNMVDGKFYGSKNPMANFLMGIASNYTETNKLPVNDQAYRNFSFYGMDDWKLTKRLTVNAGLRMEHVGRWYDRGGYGAAVWLPALYQDDVNANRMFPGLRWHATDPGIPTSGNKATVLVASPRLGFALDLLGTGKTVLRGGWGMYRWNDQPTNISTGQGTQPFNTQNKSVLLSQIGPSLLLNQTGSTTSPNAYAYDPNDHKVPVTHAYNFTISQQLPWRSLLEIAYVGNTTDNMLMGGQSDAVGIGGNDFINLNKIPLGGLFGADPVTGAAAPVNREDLGTYNFTHYFPYWQGYGTNGIYIPSHVGYSNYNGLQVSWAKQAGALSFNLNYTWSKALGIVGPSGTNSSGQGNASVDPFTVHGNYGVLSIDRPHVINMSYSYDLGNHFKGNPFLAGALDGWTVSGITTYQSGGNLQSGYGSQNMGLSLSDINNAGLTTRTYYGTNVGVILPVYTCDPGASLPAQYYLNINCITAPGIGDYGDRQAPYLAGPGYFNQDFAVRKSFKITERQKVEFRLSGSNILNHPNWILGVNNLKFKQSTTGAWVPNVSNDFGKATTKDGSRLFLLGLKYTF